MKDLNKYLAVCMRELDGLGIKYGRISAVNPNYRAKKRWGQTKALYNGTYDININIRLIQDDISDESLKSTIIHELLHTCDGCMNHGEKWKRLANRVNRRYGYNIKTSSTASEKGCSDYKIERIPRFILSCNNCGCKITYYRTCKTIQNYKRYSCGRCGGDLTLVKLD